MNQTEQSFTEFAPGVVNKDAPRTTQGNILKNVTYQRLELGQLQPSSPQHASNEPRVIINRSGEMIESIEFICPCGCSKTVSFNYEGE